jgi:hypothetical protein
VTTPEPVTAEPAAEVFVPEAERIGRIATPARVIVACVPILLMLLTPLLPFATTPTLWFGVPAVMVWTGATVVLTIVVLQVIDVGISRQTAAAKAARR